MGRSKPLREREEQKLPFYKIAEMQKNPATANPQQFVQTAAGEFMKAGIVTKPDEEGPPLHMHPNEEQFTLVLEGKLHFVLGDEERIRRLQALAGAHNLLTRQHWEYASMRELVQNSIAPFCSEGRCSIEGPDFRLKPQAAVSISLATMTSQAMPRLRR